MATTATATTTTPSSTSTKKLSGWAQAAARAAPPNTKLAQKKPEKLSEVKPTKAGVSTDLNSLSKKKDTNSPNNNNNHHNHNHNHNHKKNSNRLPYNRNEVRTYMNDLFTKYANDSSTVSYKSIVGTSKNIPATNWGTVQSKNSKNKNKKYGLLVNIAKVLKN